jgi:hypothetical protein
MFKKQEFFSNLTVYILDTNNFFFLGAFLFVASSIISLFMLSYLGFYGVFVFNLVTIFIFWLSVILKINYFLIEGNSIKIVLGKWFVL